MASAALTIQETRDFSVGRVLGRAVATVVHNPLVTLSVALLLGAVPAVALGLVMRDVLPTAGRPANADMTTGLAITGLVSWLLTMAISVIVQAALTRATVADSQGRKAGFGECLMAGVPIILPLVGLVILWSLGIGLGLMLLLIPGIILLLMWAVAIPSLVEERHGIFAAFSRSRALTHGNRWKIFGVMLILLVLYLGLIIVLRLVGLGAFDVPASGTVTPRDLSPGFLLASLLPSMLFNLAWGTIQPSLYVELRNVKDAGSAAGLHDVFA